MVVLGAARDHDGEPIDPERLVERLRSVIAPDHRAADPLLPPESAAAPAVRERLN